MAKQSHRAPSAPRPSTQAARGPAVVQASPATPASRPVQLQELGRRSGAGERGGRGAVAGALTSLQGVVGNRAVAQQVQALKLGSPATDSAQVHQAAQHGVSGPGGELPHHDAIQQSFGHHAVSGVVAHVGGAATKGAHAMQAQAFAMGNHVAFDRAPDLRTAAHEAAHVVQQSSGLSLLGGVGKAGDSHERHADAVADTVARGGSAEGLLDQYAGGGGAGPVTQKKDAVQRTPLHISAERTVEAVKIGRYWKLDASVAHECYIDDSQVDKDGRLAGPIRPYVEAFLAGGITLYRGMPRWHPAWYAVAYKHVIPSLGTGALPDFSTNNTKFIPFAPNRIDTVGTAMSKSGMGPGDRIQYLHGYSKSADQVVGAILSVRVTPGASAVAFYNTGEVQVGGPIHQFTEERLRGRTPLAALEIGGAHETLESQLAAEPTKLEANTYAAEHGSMRHEYAEQLYQQAERPRELRAVAMGIANAAEEPLRRAIVPVGDNARGPSRQVQEQMQALYQISSLRLMMVGELDRALLPLLPELRGAERPVTEVLRVAHEEAAKLAAWPANAGSMAALEAATAAVMDQFRAELASAQRMKDLRTQLQAAVRKVYDDFNNAVMFEVPIEELFKLKAQEDAFRGAQEALRTAPPTQHAILAAHAQGVRNILAATPATSSLRDIYRKKIREVVAASQDRLFDKVPGDAYRRGAGKMNTVGEKHLEGLYDDANADELVERMKRIRQELQVLEKAAH